LGTVAIGFHRGREALEQRLQVMRPGARFGVTLERERRPVEPLEAL